ncbi:MAG: SMP-30/gluconolactonase/LRE family protein [Acidimicrobiia bacterium]|nr:SMP-30/gluconolactonase/LRE family protein [Acidimicrobiia bacterium]
MRIDNVLDARAELGECPVWSARDQRLFWIDIDGRLVHRFDPTSGTDETRALAGRPGSMALTADPDRLLVAMEHELVDLTWSSGATTKRVVLEPASGPRRLNDGRCDATGRFWVGSMNDPPGNGPAAGMLHRVEPDDTSQVVQTGVGVSNGLAFSPDGSVMYFADTWRDLVWAYDYDQAEGRRSNERIFLDFADLPGRPDGACVDATGCYWIACVYGWALLRATPDGRVDRIIELPVEKPTMPAFGGAGLDTLFLTSISTGGSQPTAPGQPLAGGVLALTPGVSGLPEPVFTGPGG